MLLAFLKEMGHEHEQLLEGAVDEGAARLQSWRRDPRPFQASKLPRSILGKSPPFLARVSANTGKATPKYGGK